MLFTAYRSHLSGIAGQLESISAVRCENFVEFVKLVTRIAASDNLEEERDIFRASDMQRTRANLVTLGIANTHACIRSLRNALKVRGMHRERERERMRSISPSPFLPCTYSPSTRDETFVFSSSRAFAKYRPTLSSQPALLIIVGRNYFTAKRLLPIDRKFIKQKF